MHGHDLKWNGGMRSRATWAFLVVLATGAAGCQTTARQENNQFAPQVPRTPVRSAIRDLTGAERPGVPPAPYQTIGKRWSSLESPKIKPAVYSDVPKELDKTTMPEYRIEPPDILLVDAVKIVPKAPYHIETLDVLRIEIDPSSTLTGEPIFGEYQVDPEGKIDLGFSYGKVDVLGKTIDEARKVIEEHLGRILTAPNILAVTLSSYGAQQQVAGEHIVGQDGNIRLGSYGSVYVTGMTMDEAQAAIEQHLSKYLEQPRVSVDVYAYNSKVYYIITQGAGLGDGVIRIPVTGNETVLDAVSSIGGLESVSSKRIWIARPARGGNECVQHLPVDWTAITQHAQVDTNYQILPGDRVFIAEDKMVAADNFIAKTISPFQQLMGFTLFGNGMVRSLQRGQNASNNRFGGF
jgi:polysaccharide export outer membrane protein